MTNAFEIGCARHEMEQSKDMVEEIADCLLEDHMELMTENAAMRKQLAERNNQIEALKASVYGLYELEKDRDAAWAQAHRLALELECLIMDTKDNAIVSKWWDSAFEAMEEYHNLKPGAEEEAEAWAKMRKAGI